MSRTQEIVDQLNAYTGEDIWGDVILQLEEYAEPDTTELDTAGSSDRLVLQDGTVIEYSPGSGGGSAHSPHVAGWYEV
jgi:hypothetical protein